MNKLFINLLLHVIVLASCVKSAPSNGADNTLAKNAATSESEYKVFSTQVKGLSGLCLSKDSTFLYAVSDKSRIYELNFDGTTRRKLNYKGDNDFEAIAVNNKTGDIYLADETAMEIYMLSQDEETITEITHIDIPQGVENKGIEGLAFGNDTLYALNQDEPKLLVKYSLRAKKNVSRTEILFGSFMSDVSYDNTDKTIWICDSHKKKLYHCTTNGDILAFQPIGFVSKAEALAIDRKAGVAWIGSDDSGELYRVKLKI